jgi:predicted dehydrogenase
MSDRPRAAVVGVGFIGVAHVEALRRLDIEVVGVVGSSPERAEAKARAAHLPRVYPSYEALLADPVVDVVHLATPNRVHAPQAHAALAAGKHVVCEKPLALTAAESRSLLRAAESAGVVHAVCFNVRFYPLCHQARAMVAAGAIGAPRLVTGGYLQDWLLLPTDWNWRLDPAEAGALRAVADIGSHWLDLMRFVAGRRVEQVMAELHTLVPVRRRPTGPVETFAGPEASEEERIDTAMESDDAAGILLRLEGGARGVVAVSQVSAGRRNALDLEVDGADGALSWCSERPEELWIGHRGRPNEVLLRDPALLAPEARRLAAYPGGHAEGYPDTFRALFDTVYRAVEAGGPPAEPDYPTFADGHESMLVGEAVERSAATGRWTDVDRGGDA